MPFLTGGTILQNSAYDVMRYSVSPALGTAAAALAATTLATGATTVIPTASLTQPAVPRNVTITANQAGLTAGIVINGTNFEGQVISETITAAGASTVVGNKAFASISSIVLPQRNGAGDTVSIGYGAKLGLPTRLDTDTILHANFGGVREATRPTVVVNATNLENNTVLLNSALNASAVDLFYIAL